MLAFRIVENNQTDKTFVEKTKVNMIQYQHQVFPNRHLYREGIWQDCLQRLHAIYHENLFWLVHEMEIRDQVKV